MLLKKMILVGLSSVPRTQVKVDRITDFSQLNSNLHTYVNAQRD